MKKTLLALLLGTASITAHATPEAIGMMFCTMPDGNNLNLVIYANDTVSLESVKTRTLTRSHIKMLGADDQSTMFSMNDMKTGALRGTLIAYDGGADLYLPKQIGECRAAS